MISGSVSAISSGISGDSVVSSDAVVSSPEVFSDPVVFSGFSVCSPEVSEFCVFCVSCGVPVVVSVVPVFPHETKTSISATASIKAMIFYIVIFLLSIR